MACLALRDDNYVSSYSDCCHIETWKITIPLEDQEILSTEINADGTYYFIKMITKEIQLNKPQKNSDNDENKE